MANTILNKRSSTASSVPSAGSLGDGEIAINTIDEKMFIKNSSGAIVEIAPADQTKADIDALGINASLLDGYPRSAFVDKASTYVLNEWTVGNTGSEPGRRTVLTFDTGTINQYDGVQIVGTVIDNNTNWGATLPTLSDFTCFISFSDQNSGLSQNFVTSGWELELWKETNSRWHLVMNASQGNVGGTVKWSKSDGSSVVITQQDPDTLTNTSGWTEVVSKPSYGGPLPINRVYTSSAYSITTSGSASITHSLGTSPDLIQCKLRCITAELGYSVGDEVVIAPSSADLSVKMTSTTITAYYGSQTGVFSILNTSTRALTQITNGNWRLIITAWT